jgi:cytochrome c5
MSCRSIVSGFAALGLALVLGCGGGEKKETTTPTGGGGETPVETGGGQGGETTGGGEVAAIPVGDAGKGATVFEEACAMCHGDSGEGSKKSPAVVGEPLAKNFADDKALFVYLKEKMPKDDPGSLSDEEYANVIAWMRSK